MCFFKGISPWSRHVSLVFPHTLNIRLRFKVSVSHVAIYLFVMHIKLSLHTLAAIILCGLMSDLLPYYKFCVV